MRSFLFALLCVAVLAAFTLAAEDAAKKPEAAKAKAAQSANPQTSESGQLKTAKDKLSYTVGVAMGTNLKEQHLDVDLDIVSKGMKDVVNGSKMLLTEDEMQQVRVAFQSEKMAQMKAEADKNQKEGQAFLEANKAKEGVKTTADGLQYKVIKQGTGPKPKETDTVTVHYKGTFINGKEFDSSYSRNEPATFPLHGVIKGWTEGLQLMPVGSKYMLWIPSDLAYGQQGAGEVIPPNSTLVFEVELIGIKAPSAQSGEAPKE